MAHNPARAQLRIAELDDERTTTAELLQSRLPDSRVVKAFNLAV